MRKSNYITKILTRSPYLCVLVLALACGHPSTDSAATPEKKEPGTIASVTIIRDGQTIVSYESRTPDAVLDNDVLLIEMNSLDAKYSFIGYIGNIHTGLYTLTGSQQHDKATIHLYQEGDEMPARLTPTKGQFIITSMNGKSCSGRFSGSLKDEAGKEYIIRGHFSSVTVRNIQAGK